MGKTRASLILICGAILLAACNMPQGQGSSLYAWIDAPLNGFVLPLAPYEIVYHGGDASGISRMELSVNGQVIAGTNNPAPGSLLVTLRQSWIPPGPGNYTIRARTQSKGGAWSEYATVAVTVQGGAATPTVTATAPGTATASTTPAATVSPTPAAPAGFSEPEFRPTVISQLNGCSTKEVTVSIGATDPNGIQVVVVFYRLADGFSGDTTDWYSLAMSPRGGDRWQITFAPGQTGDLLSWVGTRIETYGSDSWESNVQMQFVIQGNGNKMTRSRVYTDSVVLKACGP